MHDFGGHLQIAEETGGSLKSYPIIVNGQDFLYLDKDLAEELALTIKAILDDPTGVKKQTARQGVLDTIGFISAKAEYDRACIIQQVKELAEAMEYELIDVPMNVADEVTDDMPHF